MLSSFSVAPWWGGGGMGEFLLGWGSGREVDIVELNEKMAKIVARQNVLRRSIDEIVGKSLEL